MGHRFQGLVQEARHGSERQKGTLYGVRGSVNLTDSVKWTREQKRIKFYRSTSTSTSTLIPTLVLITIFPDIHPHTRCRSSKPLFRSSGHRQSQWWRITSF